MAKADNMQTVSLNIERGTYQRIKALALEMSATRYTSATAVITAAIEEYLEDAPQDAGFSGIRAAYEGMNADGRAFLASCAEVAAKCPDFRR